MHRALAESIEAFAIGMRGSTRPEDRKLANDLCAALAPTLAAAVLGRDILDNIRSFERRLGHAWFVDEGPFRTGLLKWTQFRQEDERFAVSEMTVNERLVALGTFEHFEQARQTGNVPEAEQILRAAYVDPASIAKIVTGLRKQA